MKILNVSSSRFVACIWLVIGSVVWASVVAALTTGMQSIGRFAIDRTEVTVEAFGRFVAATGTVTQAERNGGGLVYDSGWQHKAGWTWRSPYGVPAAPDEPAVHVTFDEATAYCKWVGKRLPTDVEWLEAAYTERRESPSAGIERGRTYPYPTGKSPLGANCLAECGDVPAIDRSAMLARGHGHARVGTTKAGVNGLYDMGANVWEWTENGEPLRKRTRGGSWWYGATQMSRDHEASKPRDMAAVYIGFRCARSRP